MPERIETDAPYKPPHHIVNGHLGHLTDAQEEAFGVFRENLTRANLYTPDPPSHDDSTLLRFLRARSFKPDAAQKQFAETERWREHHAVDELYRTFDPVEFESTRRFYPRWTGHRDRDGFPVYVYKVAALVPIRKELEAVPPERRYQRIVALWETMRLFALPLCNSLPHPGVPPLHTKADTLGQPPSIVPNEICAVTSIVDLADVSFSTIWNLRNHLSEASRLATAYYPETLNATVVVNCPSYFPTIWGWLKGWFDEGTREKIHILGKQPGSQLRKIIHPKDLPRAYGGELDWKFEDEPALDDAAKAAVGEMPKGPAYWRDGKVVKPSQ
ncbi:CRAL/TRIO domain-containing protein [Fistulina hepatica ATCC 64428]|uniref:CRAL/TRIO domain-containing protein n=1 Tax=Fistulina hepatica ATCC 64428 TaxID=1128425 RepID=A0A0D7A9E9_9AGAR|nr:CRAL/TRIO domain-containing protein [Fistulina hepatica ATCC 64428]